MREGWTYKKLGEVASFSRGLTYSKGDVAIDSSKKVLRSNNIDLATHSLNFDDVACLKEEFVIPVEKMLQQNDIFICMSNGSTQHLGKVAFIDKKMDYAFGGFMGAVHPKVNDIFPKYAFYFCLSSEYRRLLASVLNGININNLKWSDLSKFPIPVPPLSEQQRIVSELDVLSSIIEKKKEQLKAYDQLVQSIFFDMFGDPVTNEKGWEMNTVGELSLEMRYGTSRPACEDGKYNYLRMGNLTNEGYLNLDDLKKINVPDNEIEKCIVRRGDVLFNRTNSLELIGKTCLFDLDEPMVIAGYLIRVRFKESILPLYFTRLFNLSEIKKKLRSMAKGAVHQANINAKELASIIIPVPPLPLQQSFASKIEAIEQQKALVQQSITEAETLFNSRMDYYFN